MIKKKCLFIFPKPYKKIATQQQVFLLFFYQPNMKEITCFLFFFVWIYYFCRNSFSLFLFGLKKWNREVDEFLKPKWSDGYIFLYIALGCINETLKDLYNNCNKKKSSVHVIFDFIDLIFFIFFRDFIMRCYFDLNMLLRNYLFVLWFLSNFMLKIPQASLSYIIFKLI